MNDTTVVPTHGVARETIVNYHSFAVGTARKGRKLADRLLSLLREAVSGDFAGQAPAIVAALDDTLKTFTIRSPGKATNDSLRDEYNAYRNFVTQQGRITKRIAVDGWVEALASATTLGGFTTIPVPRDTDTEKAEATTPAPTARDKQRAKVLELVTEASEAKGRTKVIGAVPDDVEAALGAFETAYGALVKLGLPREMYRVGWNAAVGFFNAKHKVPVPAGAADAIDAAA